MRISSDYVKWDGWFMISVVISKGARGMRHWKGVFLQVRYAIAKNRDKNRGS